MKNRVSFSVGVLNIQNGVEIFSLLGAPGCSMDVESIKLVTRTRDCVQYWCTGRVKGVLGFEMANEKSCTMIAQMKTILHKVEDDSAERG